jgi:hypothetical protein
VRNNARRFQRGCPLLLPFMRRSLLTLQKIKFHENLFIHSRVATRLHADMTELTVLLFSLRTHQQCCRQLHVRIEGHHNHFINPKTLVKVALSSASDIDCYSITRKLSDSVLSTGWEPTSPHGDLVGHIKRFFCKIVYSRCDVPSLTVLQSICHRYQN